MSPTYQKIVAAWHTQPGFRFAVALGLAAMALNLAASFGQHLGTALFYLTH